MTTSTFAISTLIPKYCSNSVVIIGCDYWKNTHPIINSEFIKQILGLPYKDYFTPMKIGLLQKNKSPQEFPQNIKLIFSRCKLKNSKKIKMRLGWCRFTWQNRIFWKNWKKGDKKGIEFSDEIFNTYAYPKKHHNDGTPILSYLDEFIFRHTRLTERWSTWYVKIIEAETKL